MGGEAREQQERRARGRQRVGGDGAVGRPGAADGDRRQQADRLGGQQGARRGGGSLGVVVGHGASLASRAAIGIELRSWKSSWSRPPTPPACARRGSWRVCCAPKPDAVLALPTGSTPRGIYAELVRQHREEGLSFARATAFNLDEYVGIAARPSGRRSAARCTRRSIDTSICRPTRAHAPDGQAADLAGGLRALRGGDRGGGRPRPGAARPGDRRAHRLQRADVVVRLAHAAQDAGGRDARREPGGLRRRAGSASRAHRRASPPFSTARRCLLVAFGAAKAAAVDEMVEGPLAALVPGVGAPAAPARDGDRRRGGGRGAARCAATTTPSRPRNPLGNARTDGRRVRLTVPAAEWLKRDRSLKTE